MGTTIKHTRKFHTLIIIGGIIAALVIAVPAMLISGTFAGGNDVTDTFNPVNSSYPQIEVNKSINGAAGSKLAVSADTSILTTNVAVQPSRLTGRAPGVAAVAYMTATGAGRNIYYQVYDPDGIAGYIIPGGEMVIDKAGEDPILINLKLTIDAAHSGVTTEQDLTDWNNNNPDNKVSWKSLQPAVAAIDDPTSGYFTAVDKGSAVLIGAVTDKWGAKQTVSVLVIINAAASIPENPNTVTGVAITPGPSVDIQAGSSMQFTAEVIGTDDPSQSVRWAVKGNLSPGTSINNNGTLLIASDESAQALTVYAASQQDRSKSGFITVNVITGGDDHTTDDTSVTAGGGSAGGGGTATVGGGTTTIGNAN